MQIISNFKIHLTNTTVTSAINSSSSTRNIRLIERYIVIFFVLKHNKTQQTTCQFIKKKKKTYTYSIHCSCTQIYMYIYIYI
jgi:hypothetical protein